MFIEKLNRKQGGFYTLEEEKTLINGVWEGFLDHDNVTKETLSIFTGEKFTGEKVTNFFLSTPSETPWKTYLKVFSSSPKVFVVYESLGDQVEADDVNDIQERVVVESARTDTLETVKADKAYVNAELLKKSDKLTTYTKTETDTRIQQVVGAAPQALDTLHEIALALNNDADFAGTMTTQLSGKVDKVTGKGLSTEDYTTTEKTKLSGVAVNANNYVHPASHPSSIITQTSSARFVTDTEKSNWNGKADKTYVDSTFATIDSLGNAGYGDMLKSTYDPDGDGKVVSAVNADVAPWAGITGKPSTFPPSVHTHTSAEINIRTGDLPTTLPSAFGDGVYVCYSGNTAWATDLGLTLPTHRAMIETQKQGAYGWIQKVVFYRQVSPFDVLGVAVRASYGATAWGAWSRQLLNTGVTWQDLKGV